MAALGAALGATCTAGAVLVLAYLLADLARRPHAFADVWGLVRLLALVPAGAWLLGRGAAPRRTAAAAGPGPRAAAAG